MLRIPGKTITELIQRIDATENEAAKIMFVNELSKILVACSNSFSPELAQAIGGHAEPNSRTNLVASDILTERLVEKLDGTLVNVHTLPLGD